MPHALSLARSSLVLSLALSYSPALSTLTLMSLSWSWFSLLLPFCPSPPLFFYLGSFSVSLFISLGLWLPSLAVSGFCLGSASMSCSVSGNWGTVAEKPPPGSFSPLPVCLQDREIHTALMCRLTESSIFVATETLFRTLVNIFF